MVCDISNDSILQQQIRTREEWLAVERWTQQEMAKQATQLKIKDQQLEAQEQEATTLRQRIAELEEALRQAQNSLQTQDATAPKK